MQAAAQEGPMLELFFPAGLHPMIWTHAGAVLELMGKTHIGKMFLKNVFHGVDPTMEQGIRFWGKELQTSRIMN